MRKEPLRFNVENPCHQSWDSMRSVDRGKFCQSCQKEVVDFTAMSDSELLGYFSNPTSAKSCGRFRSDQILRSIERSEIRRPGAWRHKLLAICSSFFLGLQSVRAQMPIDDEPTHINGKIVDDANESLVGANVVLVSEDRKHFLGTVTDLEGNYKLKIEPSDLEKDFEVQVSYAGYTTSSLTLQQIISKPNIEMEEAAYLLGGPVFVRRKFRLFPWVKIGASKIAAFFKKHKPAQPALNIVENQNRKAAVKKEYPVRRNVNIYPNPFIEQLTIDLEWPKSEYINIKVLNSDAILVFDRRYLTKAGNQSVELYISESLPAGQYHLVIENQAGAVNSRVLIKVID